MLNNESSPSAKTSAFHALVKSPDTGRTGRILNEVAEEVRV